MRTERRYWAHVPTAIPPDHNFGADFMDRFVSYSSRTESRVKMTNHAIREFGGNGPLAYQMVSRWVDGPYVSHLRHGVASIVGRSYTRELEKIQKRSKDPSKHEAMSKNAEEAQKDLKTIIAMATLSQCIDSDDTITCYRGVFGEQAKKIFDRSLATKRVPVALDLCTSFTTTATVAFDFAKGYYAIDRTSCRYGIVLSVKVPRYAIVATWKYFDKLWDEQEMIVASHGSMMVDAEKIIRVV